MGMLFLDGVLLVEITPDLTDFNGIIIGDIFLTRMLDYNLF